MKKIVYATLMFAPVIAFAQTTIQTGALDQIVAFISKTVNLVIPIMIGLAIIYFFWGLIQYIRSAGDPKKASEGKSIMIWGIIAIAVMVSVFGLVSWLQGLFGIDKGATINPIVIPGLK